MDDMMHLASGQGKMHRVDEIILPQKAYKGGALSLWKIEIFEKKYPNNVPKCSMQFVSKYKTDFIILLLILKNSDFRRAWKRFSGQYGDYGGYDFLLIKVSYLQNNFIMIQFNLDKQSISNLITI